MDNVTWSDIFQFGTLIVAYTTLIISIFRNKKK